MVMGDRHRAAQIIDRLDGVQGRGPQWRAICPAHESRHRSRTLAIREEPDGRVLIRCHAGCDAASIVAAVGLQLGDLFPPRTGDQQRLPLIARPWRARDVLAALEHELHVAYVVLSDVARGVALSAADRERAGIARERVAALSVELSRAR